MEGFLDIGEPSEQTSVAFDMPKKDPEEKKRMKHEWYVRNREWVLQQKRERRAAQKKLKPPKPPKPPPTPEQKAHSRELNRLSCQRYRASHAEQVRHLNRLYYHRHRERIVQQQRERRAKERQSSPFRKLRALADVCSARLLEEEYGYARIAPTPQVEEGPREKQAEPKTVPTAEIGLRGRVGTGSGAEPSSLL